MKLTNEQLLQSKKYSKEEIKKASIIMHPNSKGYNITADNLYMVFEEGSNFTQLWVPICDDFGNDFWDSEWYYMAERTNSFETKKIISFISTWHGLSTKARKLYKLDQDKIRRINIMRSAIYKKFDNNSDLRQILLDTGDSEIIEYTYWNDILFWINQDTLEWCNVLWKLLMEYRDNYKLR